jgi:hypothetical protein
MDGDTILNITIDEEEIAKARLRIAEKLERLRQGKHPEGF